MFTKIWVFSGKIPISTPNSDFWVKLQTLTQNALLTQIVLQILFQLNFCYKFHICHIFAHIIFKHLIWTSFIYAKYDILLPKMWLTGATFQVHVALCCNILWEWLKSCILNSNLYCYVINESLNHFVICFHIWTIKRNSKC